MQNRIDYEGLQNRSQKHTKKLLSQKDFFDKFQINRYDRYARLLIVSSGRALFKNERLAEQTLNPT
jgi:hypothetical protein